MTSAICRGLGEEHILHDDEGVLQRLGIDAVARDWVRTDDVERGEFAAAGGFEDLEHVETAVSRRVVLAEGALPASGV